MTTRAGMERNLRLLPAYVACSRSMVWLPTFVLFTRERFGLAGALQIAASAYLFIVVLEVPSGWMSDRVGRVATLRVAAAAFVVANLVLLFASEQFLLVLFGQFFLSTGFAFLSGTDVSFHFDTLEQVGKSDEYVERESKVASIGYLSTSVSVLLGGLLGLIDLRLPFLAAGLAGLAQLAIALRLLEPPTTTIAPSIVRQLRKCIGYLRDRYLLWIFLYGILMVTLEHVAFTLMQPWLTEVLNQSADDVGSTPLLAGVVMAIVAAVGALSARNSARLSRSVGTVRALIGLAALSAIVVTGMYAAAHVAVLALVMFRSAQGAAAPVLISNETAKVVDKEQRATFLSVNSLIGRLGYGLILVTTSLESGSDPRPVLGIFSSASWIMVLVLVGSALVLTGSRNIAN